MDVDHDKIEATELRTWLKNPWLTACIGALSLSAALVIGHWLNASTPISQMGFVASALLLAMCIAVYRSGFELTRAIVVIGVLLFLAAGGATWAFSTHAAATWGAWMVAMLGLGFLLSACVFLVPYSHSARAWVAPLAIVGMLLGHTWFTHWSAQIGLFLLAIWMLLLARLNQQADSVPEPKSNAATLPTAEKVTDSRQIATMQTELHRLRELETQLRQAKLEAEAAVSSKSEFLATMSHEIRTPLNGIIPLLDILRGTALSAEQKDYVDTAFDSSKQLLSIVDDILDYSKIEANKLELETVGFNLRELLGSIVSLMKRNADAKGLSLNATIDPKVRLAMRGDPLRLRQVLTNLISNGIKFTERGGVSILVSKRSESRTHMDLVFAIRDSGVGISDSAQQGLFKAFSQADASTTRTHGGTGLGLVICKRLSDLMGGQIGVKSEPGKGSVFWISVPLLKAIGDTEPGRNDLQGTRALLVSSDEELVKRLTACMLALGVQMVHTSIANEAIGKLRSAATMGGNWQYNFLILDWAGLRAAALGLARSALREQSISQVQVLALNSSENDTVATLFKTSRFAVASTQIGESALRSVLMRLLDAEGQTTDPQVQQIPAPEQALSAVEAQPIIKSSGSSVKAAPSAVAKAPLRGHMLLVEDNDVNRQVAQRILSLIGLSFELAQNGQIGVDLWSSGRFDAVLMDCQMPIMDGYSATRAIRQLEVEKQLARTPIIAMTANAMAGDREKCLQSGMDDYMSKPLSSSTIESVVRKWMVELPRAGKNTAPVGGEQLPVAAHKTVQPIVKPVLAASATSAAIRGGIDKTVISDLLEMMGDEFSKLVRAYLDDTPKNLADMELAAVNRDLAGLIPPAHSLKSTSANLGALKLSELSKQIEQQARSNQLSVDPIVLVDQMKEEFQAVSRELSAMLR